MTMSITRSSHTLSLLDGEIVEESGAPVIPASAYFSDPYKFDVEGQEPPLNYATGSAYSREVLPLPSTLTSTICRASRSPRPIRWW
jgi:hypothetical protein